MSTSFTKFPSSVSDTGWAMNKESSITHRGIVDYDRNIEFALEQTPEQLEAIASWLSVNQCPGWTPIHWKKVSSNTYRFSTTWDSSD